MRDYSKGFYLGELFRQRRASHFVGVKLLFNMVYLIVCNGPQIDMCKQVNIIYLHNMDIIVDVLQLYNNATDIYKLSFRNSE